MQINYDYLDDRRAYSAGFYNAPAVDNTAQDVNVPVIYAPYGTPTFWPDGSTPYVAPAQASVAPNSGAGTTVASSSLSGIGTLGADLSPSDLVAKYPSIVKPKNPQTVSPSCVMNSWVNNNLGLAILAAVGVFALAAAGGSKS